MGEMQEIWTEAIVDSTTPTADTRTDRVEALFDDHHARLYRLARRLSRDAEDARDLVQEAFLRAARRPASIPAGRRAREAWVISVLVNLCRDRQRRRAVRERPRGNIADPPAAPSDPESAAVARATVQKGLSRLSARRRAVVVLHELEELPVREVARLLRMARVTVRWHLSIARRELAAILLPEDRSHRRMRAGKSDPAGTGRVER